MKIYSIYDSKSESYGQPIYLKAKGEALRSFVDEANRTDSLICQHPKDFTLFELGEWDQSTAKFEIHKTPISMGVAIEFKKEKGLKAIKESL